MFGVECPDRVNVDVCETVLRDEATDSFGVTYT
jgi:hypothetical protein